jgi:hypothetical protein
MRAVWNDVLPLEHAGLRPLSIVLRLKRLPSPVWGLIFDMDGIALVVP